MPLLPTSTQLRLAMGVGMGHIPNFDWPAIFPALTSFLLSHRLSGC
jgi:hypothetical protein